LCTIIIYDSDFARPDTLVHANGRASVSPASLKPANIRSSRANTPALKINPVILVSRATRSQRHNFPAEISNLSLRNPSCDRPGPG
jgi:hypothetical protein